MASLNILCILDHWRYGPPSRGLYVVRQRTYLLVSAYLRPPDLPYMLHSLTLSVVSTMFVRIPKMIDDKQARCTKSTLLSCEAIVLILHKFEYFVRIIGRDVIGLRLKPQALEELFQLPNLQMMISKSVQIFPEQ